MKVKRMTEVETNRPKIGDRLRVGRYTATCQKVTEKGATFLLDQYLDRPIPMNKKNTNHGGYDNSDLRKYLQSDTVLSDFEEIRPYMVPFDNGDLLRIPFAGELFDKLPSWCTPDGHEQGPLMQDRRNRLALRCGDYEWGWINNKVKSSSTAFCFVTDDGGVSYCYASRVVGVRPAFLIAEGENTRGVIYDRYSLLMENTKVVEESDVESITEYDRTAGSDTEEEEATTAVEAPAAGKPEEAGPERAYQSAEFRKEWSEIREDALKIAKYAETLEAVPTDTWRSDISMIDTDMTFLGMKIRGLLGKYKEPDVAEQQSQMKK